MKLGYLAAALALALPAVLITCHRALAQTLTLTSSKDNTLFESATGARSGGASPYLFSGRTAQAPGASLRRAVLAFDLSGIPAGSTLESVTLTLSVSQSISGPQAMGLHRVLADWGEGTSSGGGRGGGAGAPSTPGDATWVHTFFDARSWARPGGDFSPAASASRLVGGVGSYSWGSTPELVADVQGWVDDPSSNFGWMLIGNEAQTRTARRFNSGSHPSAATRPTLTVSLTPIPEPGSCALVASGLLACAASVLRRRKA